MTITIPKKPTSAQYTHIPGESKGVYHVEMDNLNVEKRNALMRIMEKHSNIIQRYYWVSLLDSTYLSVIEPMICYDAYAFIIDFVGRPENIQKAWNEYLQYINKIKALESLL